jgi:anti-sigma factor RsiW
MVVETVRESGTVMNCVEVEELAGALALRAVPDEEAAAVYAHLAGCPEEHRLVAELTEIAALLPLAIDEIEPPATLRTRLLAAALSEGGEALLPVVRTVQADGVVDGFSPAPAPLFGARPDRPNTQTDAAPVTAVGPRVAHAWWRTPAALAVAAVLAVGLALGAWDASLQSRLNTATSARDVQSQVLAAVVAGAKVTRLSGSQGVTATLVQPADGSPAYIVGQMPALVSDKAYEAWFIRDGTPVAAGVFHNSGLTVMTLQGSATGAQSVALTLEPRAGVASPTGPLLAKGPVS